MNEWGTSANGEGVIASCPPDSISDDVPVRAGVGATALAFAWALHEAR